MATFLVNAKEWKSFVALSIVSPLLNIFYLQPKFRKFWTGVANARSVKKRALVVKKLTPRELVVDACVKVEIFMASLESCADLFAEGQDDAQVESFHHMALKYIRYKYSYYRKIGGRSARATLDWNEGPSVIKNTMETMGHPLSLRGEKRVTRMGEKAIAQRRRRTEKRSQIYGKKKSLRDRKSKSQAQDVHGYKLKRIRKTDAKKVVKKKIAKRQTGASGGRKRKRDESEASESPNRSRRKKKVAKVAQQEKSNKKKKCEREKRHGSEKEERKKSKRRKEKEMDTSTNRDNLSGSEREDYELEVRSEKRKFEKLATADGNERKRKSMKQNLAVDKDLDGGALLPCGACEKFTYREEDKIYSEFTKGRFTFCVYEGIIEDIKTADGKLTFTAYFGEDNTRYGDLTTHEIWPVSIGVENPHM
jgi:hypothetical protein